MLSIVPNQRAFERFHADTIHIRRFAWVVALAKSINPLASIFLALRMSRDNSTHTTPGAVLIGLLVGVELFYSALILMHLGGMFHYDMFAPGWLSEAWAIALAYPRFYLGVFNIWTLVLVLGLIEFLVMTSRWLANGESSNQKVSYAVS